MYEKVKLKHPIVKGDQQITELSFRKPKGIDLVDMPIDDEKMTFGTMLTIAGKLCVEGSKLPGETELVDTMEIIKIVGKSVNLGEETGSEQ